MKNYKFMTKSKTLNIILNGEDLDSFSNSEKLRLINGAIRSLTDSFQFESNKNRLVIFEEIRYLEELKKTVV